MTRTHCARRVTLAATCTALLGSLSPLAHAQLDKATTEVLETYFEFKRTSLPRDKLILACCNTGSFAAQSTMALRLAGFENVRTLHGRFGAWKARNAAPAQP